ncbi:hypothetical protein QQ054_36535 [Oscillatoria amoena NRMC-F 0135]|nr:hypothetical protein [Oscillatoria amoena NRMC-F 0135]
MADKGSVFSKGGGGTNFEQYVQASFLTTLIIQGNAPCLPPNKIKEVALQTTKRGFQTDDLLVVAQSNSGSHQLLIQIKHTLSFTQKDKIFYEVLEAFWTDYNNNQIFNKTTDKLLVIKNGLSKHEKNHLKSILNWAKTHSDETDFIKEIIRVKAKNEQLEVFRSVLKKINNNIDLTDKNLWEFLRCLEVLEYDFLNEGSVDETYIFNLIKLSKNIRETVNEKEIWNQILGHVTKLNKDGGSETYESIQKNEIYKYFEASRLKQSFYAIEKLKNDSENILTPIENDINGLHIERPEFIENVTNSINNNRITIVTGKPGIGKSALVKKILKSQFSTASIFVFRADQFNEPSFANVLSQQGINEALGEIFSCLSLIKEKILVIESFEKLLEGGEPGGAFSQFLALIKELTDINIVFTSRKYAVDLLILKFEISRSIISITEIEPLTDEELVKVTEKFPHLSGLFKNISIRKLIQIPAYLKFTIKTITETNEDLSKASFKEFHDSLWNSHVKKTTERQKGLPLKREKAFMNIAINRAKAMKLFVEPIGVDEEAVDCLESDNIIFQDNQNGKYSPTHDIFEDWALVKYVDQTYEATQDPSALFEQLGNEPAVRRGFRLWVENQLITEEKKNHCFYNKYINSNHNRKLLG